MKVSELWLRTWVNPKITSNELQAQLTDRGLEVDHVDTIMEKDKVLDTILTLKIPPNRGDCLCMEGVAREVAAINDLEFKTPLPSNGDSRNTKSKGDSRSQADSRNQGDLKSKVVDKLNQSHQSNQFGDGQIPIDIKIEIDVKAKEACPRYAARMIKNINNQVKTPVWLQERLENAGIRSLSPVVDVLNYVMLEIGQPMHAFDVNKLNQGINKGIDKGIDKGITVRFAKSNETITTLDEKEVQLNEDTLVIADGKKPQAIAGIIGGLESAVTENTNTILLESAFFNPIIIRKTAKELGLRTESSIRFERGIDPALQIRAIERATELLLEITGGSPSKTFDIQHFSELETKPKTILLPFSEIKRILGIELKEADIQTIFTKLGVDSIKKDHGLLVTIPSFRVDLLAPEDLIEEIARIYGYDKIPSVMPIMQFFPKEKNKYEKLLPRLQQLLIDREYYEAQTYSFISEELSSLLETSVKTSNHDNSKLPLVLANPISREMSVMRQSLWPGLLQALQYNYRRQVERIRLFEIGRVFVEKEKLMVAGITMGSLYQEQWGNKPKDLDFYDTKADVMAILELLGKRNKVVFDFKPSNNKALHPGQSADIVYQNQIIGSLGLIHPSILKNVDLPKVQAFNLELEILVPLYEEKHPKFQELSKFPAIRRDIAIIVSKQIMIKELVQTIEKPAGPLLQEVIIFDIYEGPGINETSKSVALGLILQHPSRTLVDSEINEVMTKVVEALAREHQAILRE